LIFFVTYTRAAQRIVMAIPRLGAGQIVFLDGTTFDHIVHIGIGKLVTTSKLDQYIGFTTHTRQDR
jgi:diphthamide synthase subunit DPH2